MCSVSVKMKFTLETIQFINLFEKVTGAKVKDCFPGNGLTFVVEEGNVQKAVRGLDRVKKMLKKDVRLISYSSYPVKFIKNLLYPVRVESVKKVDNTLVIACPNQVKGKVFGRNRENLKFMKDLVKKYFGIEEIKVE